MGPVSVQELVHGIVTQHEPKVVFDLAKKTAKQAGIVSALKLGACIYVISEHKWVKGKKGLVEFCEHDLGICWSKGYSNRRLYGELAKLGLKVHELGAAGLTKARLLCDSHRNGTLGEKGGTGTANAVTRVFG